VDEDYYAELSLNRQFVKVAEMSQVYKKYALVYLWEALSLYLEYKQEKEIEGECSILHDLPYSVCGEQ
jgi:hypothetical protein